MKTIINKTRRPLKIKLSEGRVLRLGPTKEGQITTHDVDRDSVQRIIQTGEVEVFDNSSSGTGSTGKGKGGAAKSQGFSRQFSVSKRGDR